MKLNELNCYAVTNISLLLITKCVSVNFIERMSFMKIDEFI